MYDGYFGFNERPFASVPRVDHYFPATAIEAARNTLARCIERGEGAGMVIGPSGTGKTLLCQLLAEQFKDSFQTAILPGGGLGTRRALLQAILYELCQPYRGMDEGELRLALVDYLTLSDDCPRGALLLVDESHTLPLRLLDELRMLTNLAHAGEPRVRLVLAGGCSLEERFASPKLDCFSQRLAGRCYLEAFSRAETRDYVGARIAAAGGRPEEVFPEAACDGVYKATDGVPRLINQVCDHALLLAYAGGQRQLQPAHVEEAWADLQQLPTPWNNGSPGQAAAGGVVEFGRLDDLPCETNSQSSAAPPAVAPQPDQRDVPSLPLRVSAESDRASPPPAGPAEQLQHIEQMLSAAEDDFRPAGSIGPEVELIFDDAEHLLGEQYEHEEVVADRYGPSERPTSGEAAEGSEAEWGSAAVAGAAGHKTVRLRRHSSADATTAEEENMIVVEDAYDDAPSPVIRSIVPVRRQEYGQLFAKLRRG